MRIPSKNLGVSFEFHQRLRHASRAKPEKPWGRGCINLQHVEWGKVLPTKHAIGFVKFFRGYLLVLCVDACINTLAFQDYKLQSASHHFISRQANSGVASVDNWRGEYSYICVQRP